MTPEEQAKEKAEAQRLEAIAIHTDVADTVERIIRAWGKVHNPTKAALGEGHHMIAVLQGVIAAVAVQAAALSIANPAGDPNWLRTMLLTEFGAQFDAVRTANLAPAATETRQ